jgi:hypothetical protein
VPPTGRPDRSPDGGARALIDPDSAPDVRGRTGRGGDDDAPSWGRRGEEGETRSRDGPVWFTQHSGAALFVVGCAMVFVGLFLRDGPTAVTSAFLGCGLMLVGSLLPRLAGTIKVTPGSIELALAERLEATRREVEARAPELEEAALVRALEDLLPKLVSTGSGPGQADPPEERGRPQAGATRGRWTWAAAGAAIAIVGLVGVATVGQLAMAPSGDVAAPTDGGSSSPDGDPADGPEDGDPDTGSPDAGAPTDPSSPDLPGDGVTGDGEPSDEQGAGSDPPDSGTDAPGPDDGSGSAVIVWALAVPALATGLVAVAWRRARSRAAARQSALDLEPAPAFARRIVDDLVGGARGPVERR